MPDMSHRPPARGVKARFLLGWVALAVISQACGGPDAETRSRLVHALEADPLTARLALRVTVQASVATLSGTVDTGSQRGRVLAIAQATAGVLDVIDDLAIADDELVRGVREALTGDPTVNQVPITVTSANSVVTLRSNQTDADQRRRIVALARSVDGVAAVIDEMK